MPVIASNVASAASALAVVKTATPADGTAVVPGAVIAYEIAVKNTSAAPLAVSLVDPIPAGTQYVAGTAGSQIDATPFVPGGFLDPPADPGAGAVKVAFKVPSLSANATVKFRFSVQVNWGAANGDTIVNSASVNEVASNVVKHQVKLPVVTAAKSASPASGTAVKPGDNITYSIKLTNSGLAAGLFEVYDTIPTTGSASVAGATFVSCTAACTADAAGNYGWTGISVPAGGSTTVSIVVKVNADVADGATISNQASYNPASGGYSYLTNTVLHPVAFPVLTSTKSVLPVAGSADKVTYTITTTNIGHAASAAFHITDPVPGNSHLAATGFCAPVTTGCVAGAPAGTVLDWTIPSLAPGASASVAFTVTADGGVIAAIGPNKAKVDKPNTAPVETVDTNTVTMAGAANVVAIKSVSPEGIVAPGATLTYTIKVKNWGNATKAGPLVFSDALPADFIVASCQLRNAPDTADLGSCSAAYPTTWTLPAGLQPHDVDNGFGPDEAILRVTGAVNTEATCNALMANFVTGGAISNKVVNTVQCADDAIEASKSVSPTGDVQPGQTLTYTITMFNPNPVDAAVAISDFIDPLVHGATCIVDVCDMSNPGYVTWPVVAVPAGQTVTRKFTTVVNDNAAAGKLIYNIAEISQAGFKSWSTNEVSNRVVGHNLSITKTPVAPSVTAGQPIGFDITVRNDGAGGATVTGASLSDVLPLAPGLVWTPGAVPVSAVVGTPLPSPAPSCSINAAGNTLKCGNASFNMPAGTAFTLRITSPTTIATLASSPIKNTAKVLGANDTQVTATTEVTVLEPKLTIEKVVTNSGPYALGNLINYDITLTNSGAGTQTGVKVAEAGVGSTLGTCLPSGVQATFAPGAKIVCKATHAVTQADLDTKAYTNTAKGTSNELPGGVTGAATVNFTAGGSLQVVKSVTSTGPYAIGNNATFTVKVTNNGSVTLKNVTVSEQADAVLGSCTPALPATLAPGQSLSCPGVSHVITAADQTAGTYHNTATATGLDPANVPVTAAGSADVATPPTSTALLVTKSVTSAGPYTVGSNINFSINVTNSGTASLTGVNVTEQAGATLGTCTVALPASLTPGQSFTCSAKHVVVAADLETGTYTNVATASGTDPRGGVVTVTGVASAATPQLSSDVQIIKTLTSDLLAGSNSTWQILVRNAGPGAATGISVSDVMPAGLTYVSAVGSGWSCSALGSTVTCTNAASLGSGSDLPPLTITTKVTATIGTITNTASVSSTSFDAEQANNIASANGPVKAVAAAGPTPTPVPAPVALPETGADVAPMTTYGAVLILLGMAMFVLTRRRPAHR